MNEKKFNFSSVITAVVIIGVLISIVSDLPLGQIFGGLEGAGLEGFLDNLNMILMFLTLAGVIVFLFVRAARKDNQKQKGDWDE